MIYYLVKLYNKKNPELPVVETVKIPQAEWDWQKVKKLKAKYLVRIESWIE